MKIKARQQIQTFLALTVTTVVALVLYAITGVMQDRIEDALLIDEIARGVFEIHLLTGDYLSHPEERGVQQWQRRHGSLEDMLGKLRAKGRADGAALETIADNHRDTRFLFGKIVEDSTVSARDRDPAYRELLVSQLLARTQSMVSAAFQLSRANRSRLTASFKAGSSGLLAALSVLLLFGTASSYLLGRYITRSLARLKEGTKVIAAGDLNHRIGLETPDELGDLSKDFDRMTEQLKRSQESLYREQAELRTSETLFRRLFDQSPLGAAMISMDFRFLRVNEVYCRITGYSAEEMASMGFSDITHPDDQGPDIEQARKMAAGEIEQYELEKRYIRKDGQAIWVRVNVRGIRDEAGELLYYLPVVQDITERKGLADELEHYRRHLEDLVNERTAELVEAHSRVEDLLTRERSARAEAEERGHILGALMEHIPEGITIADAPDVKIRMVSRYGQEMLGGPHEGLTAEEIIGRWAAYEKDGMTPMAPEDLPLSRAVFRGEIVKNAEIVQVNDKGQYLPLLCNAAPIRDGSGRIIGGVVAWRDIIERKKAEEKVTWLASFPERNPNPIIEVDLNEKIHYLNPAAQELFPDLPTAGLEHPFLSALRPVAKWFEEGKTRLIFRVVTVGSRDYQQSFHSIEKERRIRIYSLDITERRQLEEQLHHARRLESVGRLAGGVAHEFNNMMAVVLGYSDLLLSRLSEQSPMRREVENIRTSGERAAQLTKQLLAFGRKQMMRPRVVDINEVVRNMERMLKRLIGEHISIRTELPSDPGWINVDPAQVEQVIMNLALNARDAMPEGGRLTIETADILLDEEAGHYPDVSLGAYVRLTVRDTGIGMDQETMARIFEPFFTTKELGKGTGLGLSTVYGIVKQSGGHIFVCSEPGEGSLFSILFPQVQAGTLAEEAGNPALPVVRGKETVLIVEDEPVVLKLLEDILGKEGYTVLSVGDGREALEICGRSGRQVDLVLTDVVMPGMSGPKLAERIKKICPGIKVLFMSAYPKNDVIRNGALQPGEDFISKPFSRADLIRRTRALLKDPEEKRKTG